MLKDLRLWIVVLPFLLLAALIIAFVPPQLATILTLTVGLIASRIINKIDALPVVAGLSPLNSLSERVLVLALAGILIIAGPEVLVRIWLMPWY